MSRYRIATLAILFAWVCAGAAPAVAAPIEEQLPGLWQGELIDAGGTKLRLILKVAREKGILVARVYSPDQDNREYVAQTLRTTGRRVEFYLVYISAAYDGTMSDDGSEIRGNWTQNRIVAPLVFRRVTTP